MSGTSYQNKGQTQTGHRLKASFERPGTCNPQIGIPARNPLHYHRSCLQSINMVAGINDVYSYNDHLKSFESQCPSESTLTKPGTPGQPTRLSTTNEVEINRRELGVNTCLETTCHGSN